MDECLACGHALEAHLKGADTNPACACCRWEQPWEQLVITPVDYATNPFYAEDAAPENGDNA